VSYDYGVLSLLLLFLRQIISIEISLLAEILGPVQIRQTNNSGDPRCYVAVSSY
jgi:hypothetical protein